MDTYFRINTNKCKRCYTCVRNCIAKHKNIFGFLEVDGWGYPYYINDNPRCKSCNYECNKICPNGAMNITRE